LLGRKKRILSAKIIPQISALLRINVCEIEQGSVLILLIRAMRMLMATEVVVVVVVTGSY
jgi:hypothetical protein